MIVDSEYTAMGDAVNVAARMQSAATPGTVLVSGETYHFISRVFDVTPRGPLEVKGKSAPIDAYEIVGLKRVSVNTRGLEGIASALVGRDAELRGLRDGLQGIVDGRGSMVAIVGEAGLGKSRLIAELNTIAAGMSPPITWLEGRSISYGQTVPYYPWRQMLAPTGRRSRHYPSRRDPRKSAAGVGEISPRGQDPGISGSTAGYRARCHIRLRGRSPADRGHAGNYRCSAGLSGCAGATHLPSCWSSTTSTGPMKRRSSS